jgi:hypothetical protein
MAAAPHPPTANPDRSGGAASTRLWLAPGDGAPDAFAARVFALEWWRLARHRLSDALPLLESAPVEHVRAIRAEWIRQGWARLVQTESALLLRSLRYLPAAARRNFGRRDEAELWKRVSDRGVHDLIEIYPHLSDRTRSLAAAEIPRRGREGGEGGFRLLLHLPVELRDRIPAAEIRASWESLRETHPGSALAYLRGMPDDVIAAIPQERIEQTLLSPPTPRKGVPAGEVILEMADLYGIPESRWTERMLEAAVQLFREQCAEVKSDSPWDRAAAALHALHRAAPALQNALPASELAELWRSLAALTPSAALHTLALLPAGVQALIRPDEVQAAFGRIADPGGHAPEMLTALGRLPREMRAWLTAREVRRMARDLENHPEPVVLQTLHQLPEQLRQHILAEENDALGQAMASGLVRRWYRERTGEPGGEEAIPDDVKRLAFRSIANDDPRAGMYWLAQQGEETRRAVGPEARDRAWRAWLVGGKRGDLEDALAWAGADLCACGREPSADALVAPACLRPAEPEREMHRALLGAIAWDPLRGLALLAGLGKPLRPALSRAEVQAIWDRHLADARLEEALLLLEHAPAPLRPVPTTEDLAQLLQSSSTEVRLAAIRLTASASQDGGDAEEPRPATAVAPAARGQVAWKRARGPRPSPRTM